MTAGAPSADPVVAAVRLAVGRAEPSDGPSDWPRIHSVARAERLLGLAWLRSGPFIRQHAPPEMSARWRADVVAADARARTQWSTAVAIVRELTASGIPVSVLKGAPLSLTLYGDIAARICTDVDLLLPARGRSLAADILQRSGWHKWTGNAPWDESYARTVDGDDVFLELHSVLTGETLAHCRGLTLEPRVVVFEGESLPFASGESFPAYLAANIAKHAPAPLQSLVDLATVWTRLSDAERVASRRAAKSAGLHRYLEWALTRALALDAMGEAPEHALRLLGIHGPERRAAHAFFRLTWLAATPWDAARVLGTWAWPRSTRTSFARTKAFWARRVRERMKGRFVYRRVYVPR